MAALWVKGFRRVERAVAGPLEHWVQSETAIDAIVRAVALQVEVQRQVERGLRAYLHLWNLAALTDVRRVAQQVAHLDRQVRELSRDTEDRRG
jgi:hypothetical protein